ncbi:MAG: nuclear transport factor 2 family protein [Anaerolineae bacterium]|nr:nuclear transport factor 2 family protein [Anaerolineae bacterium]
MSIRRATEDDFEAVAQAEGKLADAHLQLDLKTIDHLLHPDYVIVQPGGKVETKAEVLASYNTGTRHWDIAQSDQLDIRLYGATAVVIGCWRGAGQHGAERFDYVARFLSIWVNQGGRWQNIAYQSTEIENP